MRPLAGPDLPGPGALGTRTASSLVGRTQRLAAVVIVVSVVAALVFGTALWSSSRLRGQAWEAVTETSAAIAGSIDAVRAWQAEAVLLVDRTRVEREGGELPGASIVRPDTRLSELAGATARSFEDLDRAAPAAVRPGVDLARERWDEALALFVVGGAEPAVFRQVLKDLDEIGLLLQAVLDDVIATNDAQRSAAAYIEVVALIGVLVVFVAVAGLVAGVARRLARRLEHGFDALVSGTERFAADDLDHRIAPTGADEIDALGAAFNAMADRIRVGVEQLEVAASTDHLTGLPNRRAVFDAALDGVSAEGAVFVLLDLDGFKEINDSLGHPVGDEVLVELARRLRDGLGPGELVARVGGDEFVLVLRTAPDVAETRVDAVLDGLRRPVTLPDGLVVAVEASAGLVPVAPGDEPVGLLRNSDVAMYEAKRTGGRGVRWFAEDLHAAAVDRLRLGAELRAALGTGQLVAHFQPVVAASTGRIDGFEALARWHHPRLGLLTPDRFIDHADRTGSIVPLGREIVDAALALATRVADLPVDPRCSVAVNLSPRQLLDDTLLADLASALGRSGVEPARLVVEVTESVIIEDLAAAVRRLDELRDLGVRISLDDFGSGYSSLGYLERLPVDVVKIDRSLTLPVLTSRHARAIIEAVVHVADVVRLDVVAEGVESEGHARLLTELGCDHLQGFWFARPMPAEQLAAGLAPHAPVHGS